MGRAHPVGKTFTLQCRIHLSHPSHRTQSRNRPDSTLKLINYCSQENTMKYSLILLAFVGTTFAEIFFEDRFDGADLEGWVQSTSKGADAGKFVVTAGKFYGDAEKDKGIQTSQDAKFYALSKEFKPFSNAEKPLVIHFTVNHKEKNHLITKEVRCKDDVFTHLYTLIVNPDATYEVLIDNESAQKGSLEDDWDILPPKKIKDPEAKKPEDWDDRAKIDDAEDTKPEDWDQPEHVADPDATKPEDWDDEMDGEWEPPMIDNPDYKGNGNPDKLITQITKVNGSILKSITQNTMLMM